MVSFYSLKKVIIADFPETDSNQLLHSSLAFVFRMMIVCMSTHWFKTVGFPCLFCCCCHLFIQMWQSKNLETVKRFSLSLTHPLPLTWASPCECHRLFILMLIHHCAEKERVSGAQIKDLALLSRAQVPWHGRQYTSLFFSLKNKTTKTYIFFLRQTSFFSFIYLF